MLGRRWILRGFLSHREQGTEERVLVAIVWCVQWPWGSEVRLVGVGGKRRDDDEVTGAGPTPHHTTVSHHHHACSL